MLSKSAYDTTPEEIDRCEAAVEDEAQRMIAEARARKAKGLLPRNSNSDRRGTAAWVGR